MLIRNKVLNSLYQENELIKVFDNISSVEDFSGAGKKGFLILVSETEATPENIEFLTKIFKAMGVNLKTDAFIFKANPAQPIIVSKIRQTVDFSQIFFFGLDPKSFGFNLAWRKYSPVEWSDYKMLAADGLTKISSDDKLKRMLWGVLKDWK